MSRKLTLKIAMQRFPDMVFTDTWRGTAVKYEFCCYLHGLYQQCYNMHRVQGCPLCGVAKQAQGRVNADSMYVSLLGRINYDYRVRRRQPSSDLTVAQFKAVVHLPCYYCGGQPQNRIKVTRKQYKYHQDLVYQGIDEVVRGQHHLVGNILPCCASCNAAKGDLPLDVFCAWYSRMTGRTLTPDTLIRAAVDFGERLRRAN